MPANEICFEPGDLVECKYMVDNGHHFSLEHDAAIVLERSISDGNVLFGERMITKLLTPHCIQVVYNDDIRPIQREAE